jgi:ABC-type Fe3+/spermidine/putrescine transport system ATPase subunit
VGRRARQQAKAREMLELVQMAHLAERLPREMSGGQQQRVALARALAVDPRILLLDEPFAALDKSLRLDMQIEVKRIQRLAGITCIMVTHDQEEALSMADRVAVINQGTAGAVRTAQRRVRPAGSLFVNRFVGTVQCAARAAGGRRRCRPGPRGRRARVAGARVGAGALCGRAPRCCCACAPNTCAWPMAARAWPAPSN